MKKWKWGNSDYDTFPSRELHVAFGNIVDRSRHFEPGTFLNRRHYCDVWYIRRSRCTLLDISYTCAGCMWHELASCYTFYLTHIVKGAHGVEHYCTRRKLQDMLYTKPWYWPPTWPHCCPLVHNAQSKTLSPQYSHGLCVECEHLWVQCVCVC